MKTNSCPSRTIAFHLAMMMVSVLLVGCTIQAKTTIESDGSGNYSTIIGLTEKEKSSFESSLKTDMQKYCDELRSGVEKENPGKTVTAKVDEHEGITQCTVEIAFNNLDELRQIYEREGQITVNRLELKDKQLIYDITFPGKISEDSTSPSGQLGSQLGGLLAGTIDASWQVKMPGRIGKNNADRVEKNVLIWQLETTESDQNFSAESKTGGLSLAKIAAIALSLLCILGMGLGAIGVFVFWIVRNRKSRGKAPSIDSSG